MDGYFRDGDTVKRGSNPMFTFCMDYSTPEIMEAAKDAIVRLLNDDNDRQEFTPAKYSTPLPKVTWTDELADRLIDMANRSRGNAALSNDRGDIGTASYFMGRAIALSEVAGLMLSGLESGEVVTLVEHDGIEEYQRRDG